MPNNLKGYDGFQVLRSVFDVDQNCLRVKVIDGIAGPGSGIEVIIDHTNDSIRLGDGTQLVTATSVSGKVGLDVNILTQDIDIRDLDSTQDSVTIGDPDGDTLDVQPDGSIIIKETVNSNNSGLYKYNEISSLASGVETIVVSHTTVGGRDTFLQRVEVSGDNIAKYRVKVNGVTINTKRTYFGGDLEKEFIFDGNLNPGLKLTVGDIITVTVEHDRSSIGDFNARIQYLEVI